MKRFLSRIYLLVFGVLAILGLNYSNALAVTNDNINVSKSKPFYLVHANQLFSQNSNLNDDSDHYSHESHESHSSHESHESHYSHYSSSE